MATIFWRFFRIPAANRRDSRHFRQFLAPGESINSIPSEFCRVFGKFGNAPSAGMRYAGEAKKRRSADKKDHSAAHSHTFPPMSNPVPDAAEPARDAAAPVESLVLQRFEPGDAASVFPGLESAVGEIAAGTGRDVERSSTGRTGTDGRMSGIWAGLCFRLKKLSKPSPKTRSSGLGPDEILFKVQHRSSARSLLSITCCIAESEPSSTPPRGTMPSGKLDQFER